MDAAVAMAREHLTGFPGTMTKFADALVEAGAGEAAVALLSEQTARGRGYEGWLAKYFREHGDPHAALALYKELAERAIEEKNRSAYQTAAQFLKRMNELHGRLHTDAEWDVYIGALRARYARLPALQDELRKAK